MTNDPSFQQPVNIGAHERELLKRQDEVPAEPDKPVEAASKTTRKSRKR